MCTQDCCKIGAHKIPWGGQFAQGAVLKFYLYFRIKKKEKICVCCIHIFRLEICIGRGTNLFLDWEKSCVKMSSACTHVISHDSLINLLAPKFGI